MLRSVRKTSAAGALHVWRAARVRLAVEAGTSGVEYSEWVSEVVVVVAIVAGFGWVDGIVFRWDILTGR